jgi:hypothetical protein
MSQYFKFESDSDLGVGTQYIEFNDRGGATRQAECYGNRWFNSTKTYHKELGSMSLCDQQLTKAGMALGEQIDAEEFELVWKSSIEKIEAKESESAWELSNRVLVTSQISSTKESRNIINTPRHERPSREGYWSGRLNELRMRLSDLRLKLSIETSAETRVILEGKIQQIEKFIKFREYRKLKNN